MIRRVVITTVVIVTVITIATKPSACQRGVCQEGMDEHLDSRWVLLVEKVLGDGGMAGLDLFWGVYCYARCCTNEEIVEVKCVQ